MLNELGAFLGSSYVSNFNKYNQVYQVTMQLRPTDRADLHSLDRLFVRSDEGAMLPVSQFVTLRKEYMPQSLNRFNMVGSIGIVKGCGEGSHWFSELQILILMAGELQIRLNKRV